ncbi:MAG TPA: hypothetical protein VLQ48_12615 [Chloroflexia bacterium]|nr:hypothetical protein [Chloroflexia bacterium]
MTTTRTLWDRLFAIAVACLLALVIIRPFFLPVEQGDHYVYLAEHLVRGELSVNDIPADYSDVITWEGNKYLPFGPLPAVVAIPFLPLMDLAGTRDMVWVGLALTLVNIFLLARVLGQMGLEQDRRKWALLLFFGGTTYYASLVVSATWYFAHLVVTTCYFLAISEALGKKRVWLVGLFIGLAGMTRLTALFALPFFVWLMWWDSRRDKAPAAMEENQRKQTAEGDTPQKKVQAGVLARYALLLAGLLVPLIVLGLYNYARFANPLESGYGFASLTYGALEQAREHGVFGLVHIPKNLFMLLLQSPVPYPSIDAPVLEFPYIQPSPWGMGLIFVSPALFYAFRANIKERFVQACWLAVVFIMVPVITYYGVGWVQFGYRYGLDFIPFLLLLAAIGLGQPMSKLARVLILVGVVVNIWGAFWLSKWV